MYSARLRVLNICSVLICTRECRFLWNLTEEGKKKHEQANKKCDHLISMQNAWIDIKKDSFRESTILCVWEEKKTLLPLFETFLVENAIRCLLTISMKRFFTNDHAHNYIMSYAVFDSTQMKMWKKEKKKRKKREAEKKRDLTSAIENR